MKILYPFNPLNNKEADEPYQDEFLALQNAGVDCALFDFDSLDFEFKPEPRINKDEDILYRGWMLNPDGYEKLVRAIQSKGGQVVTSVENYAKCHHLPGWYEQCKKLTPETHFFPNDDRLKENLEALSWNRFFIKDYVKSNSTEKGSIANSADEALEIISLIENYRGTIEGGVSVRKVEEFISDTEERYFVFNSKAYTATDEVPMVVEQVAEIVDAPFFSVDTIRRADGVIRVVEIGDGQVSDRKSWPVAKFVEMLVENDT